VGQFRSGRNSTEWKPVLDLVRRLGRGKDLAWTAVDAVTAEISAASNVDQVLERLRMSDVTLPVKARFWQVAQKSRRVESVKWGIAIGGIGLRPEELEPLVALAHHAEFTLYAAHVLMREGARDPRYRQKLVELLPRARQWGVIHLIDYIVVCDELVADAGVQRDVLVYGMENNDGIPMEVAFTIAKAVDVRGFVGASRDDERLRRAVCDLMDSLLTQGVPRGGLTDLDGWEQVYDTWVDFLEARDADVLVLGALRSLRAFLEDERLEWSRKAEQHDRIERLWQAKFSAAVLRQGLQDLRDRWLALVVIEEQQIHELLPEVRQAHAKKPDYSTIRVLAKIGSEEDLEALRGSIDQLVDLQKRRHIPLSTKNVFGPEHAHASEYAQVVRAMARLPTRGAVTTIKQALVDYDPVVRSAGCDAVANMKGDLVDDEIRAAVRSRLDDAPPYVVESARRAAQAHGIPN
jgi:hypothetical protein